MPEVARDADEGHGARPNVLPWVATCGRLGSGPMVKASRRRLKRASDPALPGSPALMSPHGPDEVRPMW